VLFQAVDQLQLSIPLLRELFSGIGRRDEDKLKWYDQKEDLPSIFIPFHVNLQSPFSIRTNRCCPDLIIPQRTRPDGNNSSDPIRI
jgi:hypothetical protein